jgi:ubiquitin carboxyl-terminal hydrolase 5/13
VSVKLGTITAEGSAGEDFMPSFARSSFFLDIYCYSCNDAMLDPELALHLSTFGINVQAQTKTEKSMTELVLPTSSILSYTYATLSSKLNTT